MKNWTVGDRVRGAVYFTESRPKYAAEDLVMNAVVQAEIEGHARLAWVMCEDGKRALMRDPQIMRSEA